MKAMERTAEGSRIADSFAPDAVFPATVMHVEARAFMASDQAGVLS
jgi:hypothetical protein